MDNFDTSPGHTSLFLETKTINFMWPWGLGAEGRHMEPRAEKNKYPKVTTFLIQIIFHSKYNKFNVIYNYV